MEEMVGMEMEEVGKVEMVMGKEVLAKAKEVVVGDLHNNTGMILPRNWFEVRILFQ